MPFENIPSSPAKIAIIGGGISGMSAAYFLSPKHQVTLFESNARLGGHARTLVAGKNGDQPVDTGFIVFNYPNYPNLSRLFKELDVPVKASDMSFGISINNGQFEYATGEYSAVFAQKRNLMNPRFYGMLRDIFRFNKHALELAKDPSLTIGALIERLGLGKWFQNYFLLPISGAIWSTPLHRMMDFPAQSLVSFFENHNLLAVSGQHQWYTVDGGSIQYVNRLADALKARMVDTRLSSNIQGVRRTNAGVQVRDHAGVWEDFDRVVFACHSDEALAMIEDANTQETNVLSRIKYQDNHTVLHCDPSVMPKRKAVWSSWVYTSDTIEPAEDIGVTYWMNKLQSIPNDDLLLGSLNPTLPIKDELIYDEKTFRHPVFDHGAMSARKEMETMQGKNNTWFCGAYLGNGFHEDGITSAVSIAEQMEGMPAWA